MITGIVVDDEKSGREAINSLLSIYAKNRIDIVKTCSSVEEGYQALQNYDPDVVFLDIKMPRGTGFDVLKQARDIDTEVIFVTAFKEYGADAYQVHAIGYLLKPVSPESLVKTLDQLESVLEGKKVIAQQRAKSKESTPSGQEKLAVEEFTGVSFIKIENIVLCTAKGNHTDLFLKDGSKVTSIQRLKIVEEKLPKDQFFRVHVSCVINLEEVKRLIRKDNNVNVEMSNGTQKPVSRRKKDQLMDLLT